MSIIRMYSCTSTKPNIEDPKAEGRTGYRAVIKSISDDDLPVHFVSDIDQDRIKDLVLSPDLKPIQGNRIA